MLQDSMSASYAIPFVFWSLIVASYAQSPQLQETEAEKEPRIAERVRMLTGLSAEEIAHQEAEKARRQRFINDFKDWPENVKDRMYSLPQSSEALRSLRDDDPVLAALFCEVPLKNRRTPWLDMIELEMWRRGDSTIEIMKEVFRKPPLVGYRQRFASWLTDVPWMRPKEFLPLVREWYPRPLEAEYRRASPFLYQQFAISMFTFWGEPQDEALLQDFERRYPRAITELDWNRFRVRLAALAQNPDAYPIPSEQDTAITDPKMFRVPGGVPYTMSGIVTLDQPKSRAGWWIVALLVVIAGSLLPFLTRGNGGGGWLRDKEKG